MIIPRLASAAAVCAILVMAACAPMPPQPSPPAAPTLVSLEIPTDTFGKGFTGVTPAVPAMGTMPANFFVLPLQTATSPVVRAVLTSPYPAELRVTATDVGGGGQAVTLPQLASGSPMPSSGAFQVIRVTPNNPATWLIVVRYPDSFQGSRLIATAISDVVGGVASAPLPFSMSFDGATVTVSVTTATNGDGRVTSDPPGIDCPGACSAAFTATTDVRLTQSITRNQTQFIGWTGTCIGGNTGDTCRVPVRASGIPLNVAVAADFRIRTSAPIPPADSSCRIPTITGMQWAARPNCGLAAREGAVADCDVQGWFCCGARDGKPSARCSGQNETPVTCQTDPMGGTGTISQLLVQPGGCYESKP
jgi:hypothetical protein